MDPLQRCWPPRHALLLIFDGWPRDPSTASQARDLLEIIDDGRGRASTPVAN
jgi:hypothetical protein